MDLETRLASDLATLHPIDGAQALERLPASDAAVLVGELEIAPASRLLQRMASHAAGAVLAELDDATAAGIVEHMPTETAALLLRRLEEPVNQRILAALPRRRAQQLASVFGFPEGTAGALMNPEVLALPQDLSVEEAVTRVREAAGDARYNVYVVDREQVLVGVINLRELLMAAPGDLVSSLMKTALHRLPARADRHTVVSHPGWREVHALPVVDAKGRYLGAIRYRTLRRLEEGLRVVVPDEGATARALGGLFRAGAAGMLEAVATSMPAAGSAPEQGRS